MNSIKKISLLLITIFTFSAQAIVTRDCPEIFGYFLTQVEAVDPYEMDPAGLNDRAYHMAQRDLENNIENFHGSLQITERNNGICRYQGLSSGGQRVFGRIEGSLRENAASPATLIVYHNPEFVTYTRLENVLPHEMTASNQDSLVYFRGESCGWGGCVPNHFYLGRTDRALFAVHAHH